MRDPSTFSGDWTPGLPSEPCLALVRPTRPIFLSFKEQQSDCWPAGVEKIARFARNISDGGIVGLLRWPAVGKGTVVIIADSPVEWCALPVPDGVPADV